MDIQLRLVDESTLAAIMKSREWDSCNQTSICVNLHVIIAYEFEGEKRDFLVIAQVLDGHGIESCAYH